MSTNIINIDNNNDNIILSINLNNIILIGNINNNEININEINTKNETNVIDIINIFENNIYQILSIHGARDGQRAICLWGYNDDEQQYQLINKRNKNLGRVSTKSILYHNNNNNNKFILISDLSGEVNAYSMNLNQENKKLITGHEASIITNMLLINNNKYNYSKLITGDRDYKIKITNLNNIFDIDYYLLGHEDVITSIHYIESMDLLISGSRDGNIIIWSILTGQSLYNLHDNNHIINNNINNNNSKVNDDNEEKQEEIYIVSNICFNNNFNHLIISFINKNNYNESYIKIYTLLYNNNEIILNEIQSIYNNNNILLSLNLLNNDELLLVTYQNINNSLNLYEFNNNNNNYIELNDNNNIFYNMINLLNNNIKNNNLEYELPLCLSTIYF